MTTLTIRNDYHNTEVNLRVDYEGPAQIDSIIYLTASQVKRSKRELCASGCICSGPIGDRAPWHVLGDTEVKLNIEETVDNHTGRISGARISIEKIWR